MSSRPTKEPVRKPWIWIVMALIMLAGIPWYLPTGSLSPVILGLPYWMLISIVSSLVLCGYLSWVALNEWDVVEEEEEAQRPAENESAANGGEG